MIYKIYKISDEDIKKLSDVLSIDAGQNINEYLEHWFDCKELI